MLYRHLLTTVNQLNDEVIGAVRALAIEEKRRGVSVLGETSAPGPWSVLGIGAGTGLDRV